MDYNIISQLDVKMLNYQISPEKKKFLQIKSEVFPKNKANFPQICMQCVTSHLHILLEKVKYVYSNIPLNK